MVFDIPLLYETKAEQQLDLVLVVSAPADVQRQRVLARPGMTPEKLAAILARQASELWRQQAGGSQQTLHVLEDMRCTVMTTQVQRLGRLQGAGRFPRQATAEQQQKRRRSLLGF